MGAITMEIEKLNKTMVENQKEVEKLTRQLEKSKEEKKAQREYERDLKIAVENDLISTMKGYFEREPFQNACINLQLLSTRQEILDNVPESEFERSWVDKNYERIFNKVKKIYSNNEKAKLEYEQLKMQQEEELIQNTTSYKVFIVLSIVGFILFLAIKWFLIVGIGATVLLFIFLSMCAKGK